jgi:periplasmic divalent cation tolerance protein
MQFCSVYITARDESEARKIGRALVEEKLAACANIFPIVSVYRWKGDVEDTTESAVLLKTRSALVPYVVRRVKDLHSYEIPCIITQEIKQGDDDYLKWIEESTAFPTDEMIDGA